MAEYQRKICRRAKLLPKAGCIRLSGRCKRRQRSDWYGHVTRYSLCAHCTEPPLNRHTNAPPERSEVLRWRLASSAPPPPLERMRRKSDRCTATRLIEPAASTSTTFHPDG